MQRANKKIIGEYTEKLLAEIVNTFSEIIPENVNELAFLRVQENIKKILLRETLVFDKPEKEGVK